jgi:hypothetical protein
MLPIRSSNSGSANETRAMNAADRERFDAFVDSCRVGTADFRLTPAAEPSAYARCFGVFNLQLTQRFATLERDREALVEGLIADIAALRTERRKAATDKAYRQLLAFTLSALAVLGAEGDERIGELVAEQLPADHAAELRELGCLNGEAQSGNQAMFLAIFLLHARRYLDMDTSAALDDWVRLHLEHMNRFGFWGSNRGPTHLHFQNGYHQYEVLEYLDIPNPRQDAAVAAVRSLADARGHFAPYPGGGSCFDYDAVFVLTPDGATPDTATARLLETSYRTVLGEQQTDGGFCESLWVRPRTKGILGALGRLASANNTALLMERLRYALTLQRHKHDRIATHWSRYHRRWGESNLWDSYFRMLLIARIECAFDPAKHAEWGFIDYPGIGWHPSLRRESGRTEASSTARIKV